MPNEAAGRRLTRAQKRELGLLPWQQAALLQELAQAGEITKDMTPREIAAIIAIERMSSEEYGIFWSQASSGEYSITLEEIIVYVEWIVKVLLILLPIFI